MPKIEEVITSGEEEEVQLESAKNEYEAASNIAVDVANARITQQKDNEA